MSDPPLIHYMYIVDCYGMHGFLFFRNIFSSPSTHKYILDIIYNLQQTARDVDPKPLNHLIIHKEWTCRARVNETQASRLR